MNNFFNTDKSNFLYPLLILSLFAIIFLSLTGCASRNIDVKNTDVTIDGKIFKIYLIDSCEYIGFDIGQHSGVLTHKGNCKNSTHNK